MLRAIQGVKTTKRTPGVRGPRPASRAGELGPGLQVLWYPTGPPDAILVRMVEPPAKPKEPLDL